MHVGGRETFRCDRRGVASTRGGELSAYLLQEALLVRRRDGLRAAPCPELLEDALNQRLDGLRADREGERDLGVRLTRSDEHRILRRLNTGGRRKIFRRGLITLSSRPPRETPDPDAKQPCGNADAKRD
jgi:hypothetical protein